MTAQNKKCEGHPADEFSPMGQTVYCDGSCKAVTGGGNAPRVGERVRLTVEVDRYPHFVAPEGATGQITLLSVNPPEIHVRMDEKIDGCEEWDNEVIWQDGDCEYFNEQTELIRG